MHNPVLSKKIITYIYIDDEKIGLKILHWLSKDNGLKNRSQCAIQQPEGQMYPLYDQGSLSLYWLW